MILLLIFVLLINPVFASETEQKVFEVSRVQADKTELHIAFNKIRDLESARKYRTGSFQVMQVIDKNNFLVHRAVTNSIDGYPRTEILKHHTYYLKTLEPKNLADGSIIKDIRILETNETESYLTVLGTKKTVRIFKEVIPKKMTQKEFVSRLKAGETWSYFSSNNKQCFTCRGEGKIRPKKRKVGVVFETCGDCRGKGQISINTKWLVKW